MAKQWTEAVVVLLLVGIILMARAKDAFYLYPRVNLTFNRNILKQERIINKIKVAINEK